MPTIKYTSKAIVITLSCHDPAAYHARLLQSLASINNKHTPEMQPLVELLKSILPNEHELQKAYQDD